MSDWKHTTLGAELTLQRGFDITRAAQRQGSIPVVSSSGISSYHDESAARGPGVVIGRKGVVGSAFYLEGDYWPHDTTLWVKDFHGNHPRFAYFFLKNLNVAAFESGSANPTLNRNHIHPIPVSWPSVTEQKAIASILGSLDDKIDVNRRMNRTLEALITGQWQVAQKLMDCTTKSVATLAEYINGGAYTKGSDGIGRPVIRIRELNGGLSNATPRSSITPPESQVAKADDLLFSWSGSLDVYRWQDEEAIVNQHIFKVLPRAGYPQWLVHEALKEVMPFFQSIARDKATTMGHIQRGHLEEAKVLVPDGTAIRLMTARVGSMYDLIGRNDREARTLAALRDTLLPELISGAIRVKQAEQLVGSAT